MAEGQQIGLFVFAAVPSFSAQTEMLFKKAEIRVWLGTDACVGAEK